MSWISSLATYPYSSLFASGGADSTVRLWQILSNGLDEAACIGSIHVPGFVNGIAFLHPGRSGWRKDEIDKDIETKEESEDGEDGEDNEEDEEEEEEDEEEEEEEGEEGGADDEEKKSYRLERRIQKQQQRLSAQSNSKTQSKHSRGDKMLGNRKNAVGSKTGRRRKNRKELYGKPCGKTLLVTVSGQEHRLGRWFA